MKNDKEQRQSFVFHRDWFDVISQMDDNSRLQMYDAIMQKVWGDDCGDLPPLVKMAMRFISPQIERDTDKWLRIKTERQENGRLGGLAKQANASKCYQKIANDSKSKQDLANLAVSVSVSDSVSVDNISKDNVIIKEKEKEDKSSFKKKRFVKPLVADVDAYVKEKGYHIDAEMFFNFYESKGWMIGKNKMQDWRKAVVTWERKWKAENTRTSNEGLFNQETNNPYPKGYWQ